MEIIWYIIQWFYKKVFFRETSKAIFFFRENAKLLLPHIHVKQLAQNFEKPETLFFKFNRKNVLHYNGKTANK